VAVCDYVVKNCINTKSVKLLIIESEVLLQSFTPVTQEQGCVVDIVTRPRARETRDGSLIPGEGTRFISSPSGPERI
jgi:hypothetical protein